MKTSLLGNPELHIKVEKSGIDNYVVYHFIVEDGNEPYTKRFFISKAPGNISLFDTTEEIIHDKIYLPKDDLLTDYIDWVYSIMMNMVS